MRAVVTGLAATFPVGGVFWDYVHYALGLESCGVETWYLEDADQPCYEVAAGDYDYEGNWQAHAARLGQRLAAVSPTLGQRWCLRSDDGRAYGLEPDAADDLVAGADLLLNVSGCAVLRKAYQACARTVYVDTDPGWNHYMRWPRAERQPSPIDAGWRAHDAFATYAWRLGAPDCPLPDHGLDWIPTRPPVDVRRWVAGTPPARPTWTTVLSWDNAPEPISDGVRTYGTKEQEFARIEDLPRHVAGPLELAVGGWDPPVERWRRQGWSVVDGPAVTATPDAYRDYVQASRGELSVAKHVYAATRCGWFSCRSACYLAAGRPVVVQDTGFSEALPTGDGLLAFTTPAGAVDAVRAVEADYDAHAAAASRIAVEHFDAERVVADLLGHVLP